MHVIRLSYLTEVQRGRKRASSSTTSSINPTLRKLENNCSLGGQKFTKLQDLGNC